MLRAVSFYKTSPRLPPTPWKTKVSFLEAPSPPNFNVDDSAAVTFCCQLFLGTAFVTFNIEIGGRGGQHKLTLSFPGGGSLLNRSWPEACTHHPLPSFGEELRFPFTPLLFLLRLSFQLGLSKPNFGLSAAVGFPGDTLSTSSLLLVGLVFIREHYV